MEQSNAEGPTGCPTTVAGVEFGEHIFGVMASAFGNGEYAYDDSNDTTEGPEDGKCLIR